MALFRRRSRSRPIRFFLISMFALPLVSLVALWGFAASITIPNAVSDQDYNSITRAFNAGIAALEIGLPEERAQSYLWLVTGRRTPKTSLLAARNLVDNGLPRTRALLETQLSQLSGPAASALSTLVADLGQLNAIRTAIDSDAMSPTAAFQAYTSIIDVEFQYYYAAVQGKSTELADVSIGAVDGDYSVEMTGRETVLVDGALADRGRMSEPARQMFVSSASERSLLLNQALAVLTPSLRGVYIAAIDSPEYRQFRTLESRILGSTGNGPIPVSASAWETASEAYLAALQGALTNAGTIVAAQSASLSDTLLTKAILAGGVGLVAVAGAVFLLAWFGRKVTGDLTRLHGSVRSMAEERLPRVVERLRQGDDVDVPAESPPPDTSTIREIAQIAGSFGTVQEAAVTAAVDQAKLRKGVNQVFLNISMRNQSLLHRQLTMLDAMERRTSEPGALADLFRIDHLTTRMRRHAEGLIILSGSTPGRGWRDPVPFVDVLRAAVAEVEDYVRVDVVSESRDLVAGSAVSDVIHLAAELIENATVFSPPNTRIEVRAERVGNGLVAEIEDRGLGLSATERAEINWRLDNSPEFDLAGSEQLGLFVVGQLAARHGIKVSLRESMYGGITAVLLLPFGVAVREEEAAPSGEHSDMQDRLAERNRLLASVPEGSADAGASEQTAAAERPAEAASWDAGGMTPWPRTFQPNPIVPASSSPGQPERTGADPGPPGSHLGMPVRVPQATLTPQLRAARTGQQPTEREVNARSPEAHRDQMITMHEGWRRGRVDDLDDPDGAGQ